MSPPGGRRPVPHNVYAIEDEQLPLPNPIALDTSFVVEALLPTEPLHAVCDAFLKRIFDSGVTVVTSELLRLELAETAFANAMKERWAGKWRAHRTDGRSRPRAGRRMNDTISAIRRARARRPHPGAARRHHDRGHRLHDQIRTRLLRRGPRGQCR